MEETLKPILKQFIEGECFICGEKVEKDHAVHFACAIAYADEKEKIIKEYYIKRDKIIDDRYEKRQKKKEDNR